MTKSAARIPDSGALVRAPLQAVEYNRSNNIAHLAANILAEDLAREKPIIGSLASFYNHEIVYPLIVMYVNQ